MNKKTAFLGVQKNSGLQKPTTELVSVKPINLVDSSSSSSAESPDEYDEEDVSDSISPGMIFRSASPIQFKAAKR